MEKRIHLIVLPWEWEIRRYYFLNAAKIPKDGKLWNHVRDDWSLKILYYNCQAYTDKYENTKYLILSRIWDFMWKAAFKILNLNSALNW